jgi:hypothetical protein
MKKAVLFIAAFFSFTAFAAAQQEVQERIDMQQAPVTQTQVEQDARVAQLERQKNEPAGKRQQQDIKQEEQKQQTTTNTFTNNKASVKPGKQ